MNPDRPRLLVVDDEPELRSLLAEYFGRHGFEVEAAADAQEARARIAATPIQAAILDVHMPGETGLSLARWLREAHPAIGLLMLTTASDSVDRIVGLELGADDYLCKPFELRELLARLRAVLRRSTVVAAGRPPPLVTATALPPEPTRSVRFGACTLDIDRRKLFDRAAIEVEITAAEFDLLELFSRHPNRPLNRDQIMEQAHHRGWDVYDRSIDLRIMRLRRKIETNPDKPEVLKTVRSVGYVFIPSGPEAAR